MIVCIEKCVPMDSWASDLMHVQPLHVLIDKGGWKRSARVAWFHCLKGGAPESLGGGRKSPNLETNLGSAASWLLGRGEGAIG